MNEKKVDYSYPITENERTTHGDGDYANMSCLGWPGHVVDNNIHPDGQPWKKCCGVCAYTDPRGNRLDNATRQRIETAQTIADGARFFCIHQTEGEMYRVCAGFHARDGRHLNTGEKFSCSAHTKSDKK